MADITWPMVVIHAAELSVVPSDLQDDILAFVNERVAIAEFGEEGSITVKFARIYLAAHFAARLPAFGGGSGPVTAEKLGDESRSYGAFAMTTAALGTTSYGVAYCSLVNTSAARAPILL